MLHQLIGSNSYVIFLYFISRESSSMEITKASLILIMVLLFVSCMSHANAYYYRQCSTKGTRCYGKYIRCPTQYTSSESTNPKAKVCLTDCDKPICGIVCKSKTNH